MTKKQLEQNHLMSLAQQCTCLEILVIEKCSLKAEPNLDLNTFFQRLPLLKVGLTFRNSPLKFEALPKRALVAQLVSAFGC